MILVQPSFFLVDYFSKSTDLGFQMHEIFFKAYSFRVKSLANKNPTCHASPLSLTAYKKYKTSFSHPKARPDILIFNVSLTECASDEHVPSCNYPKTVFHECTGVEVFVPMHVEIISVFYSMFPQSACWKRSHDGKCER